MSRLDVNGQNGLTTDFRTLNAATPYVRNNVLCFLLEAPAGFRYLPGSNGRDDNPYAKALKSLMETQAESIDGLNATVKAEYVEVNVGATEVMSVFSRTTRERSEPTFKWTEKQGLAIYRLFHTWTTLLMGDPVTGIPGILSLHPELNGLGNANQSYTLTPENISATAIFIEPDPTHRYPNKAWLCSNLMPTEFGEYTGSRDITQAGDKMEVSVKFTCVQEVGLGVDNLAQKILDNINLGGIASSYRRASIGNEYKASEEPRVAVMSNINDIGYIGQTEDIATTDRMTVDNNNVTNLPQG